MVMHPLVFNGALSFKKAHGWGRVKGGGCGVCQCNAIANTHHIGVFGGAAQQLVAHKAANYPAGQRQLNSAALYGFKQGLLGRA